MLTMLRSFVISLHSNVLIICINFCLIHGYFWCINLCRGLKIIIKLFPFIYQIIYIKLPIYYIIYQYQFNQLSNY